MGLVLDYGFVRVHGGSSAALTAAAEAVSRANAIFEDQLGVRVVVSKVIVNTGSGGSYSSTGPNSAPSDGNTSVSHTPLPYSSTDSAALPLVTRISLFRVRPLEPIRPPERTVT